MNERAYTNINYIISHAALLLVCQFNEYKYFYFHFHGLILMGVSRILLRVTNMPGKKKKGTQEFGSWEI